MIINQYLPWEKLLRNHLLSPNRQQQKGLPGSTSGESSQKSASIAQPPATERLARLHLWRIISEISLYRPTASNRKACQAPPLENHLRNQPLLPNRQQQKGLPGSTSGVLPQKSIIVSKFLRHGKEEFFELVHNNRDVQRVPRALKSEYKIVVRNNSIIHIDSEF